MQTKSQTESSVPLRILIPVSGFGRSGGYRVLSELANHWILEGAKVTFLADHRTEPPYFPTTADVKLFNKHGVVLTPERTGETFQKQGNGLSIYFGMWRALTQLSSEYDIILANHSLTTFPIALARDKKAKKFYYIQAYEPGYYELEKGFKSRILKHIAELSYRLRFKKIVNSPIYLDYRSIKASAWIPPGIDMRIFHRRLDEPASQPDGIMRIGVIGRGEPSKGLIYALQAFEALAKLDSKCELHVAYGNLPPGWTHPNCKVVTPQNDRELSDFYRSLDALIAPGIVQLGACHYPVLEAMACGTPVVTTGYLPADQTNAWIVPVKNPEAIVSAIRSIKQQSIAERRARLDLAAQAVNDFSWSKVSNRFLTLLTN